MCLSQKQLTNFCDSTDELITKIKILIDTETDEKRKQTLEECLVHVSKIKDIADYLC